jgi:Protein of unknown function (DUF3631)
MLGLLNSGFEKEGQVGRMERKEDGSFHLMRFSVFAPVILIATSALHPSITSRSILIEMLPPLPGAPKLPKVGRKAKAIAAELARRFARWSEDNRDRVRATIDEVAEGDEDGNATYVVPDDLRARAADKWTPFFILAHLAGGTWPARVREAWRALQPAKGLTELDLGVQLLIACRDTG